MELDAAATAAGVRLTVLDTCGSTNIEALHRARAGERGPLWVVAHEQTAGRGRRGRQWISADGNLYASLLLSAPSPPRNAAQLSFVAALATHDAILGCAPDIAERLTLKWPNDVLCDGRKLAGILIEGEGTQPLTVAIGIGVNCRSHPEGTAYPASDLAAAGYPVTAAAVFAALSASMLRRLRQWDEGGGFPAIRADWIARAYRLGCELLVRVSDRDIRGSFETVDETGRLVLRTDDGTLERITAGDVFPLPSGEAAGTERTE
jgi:BirA family biotin operon repressor/biotin-[acetyl-CoA-carboxylase] ligase